MSLSEAQTPLLSSNNNTGAYNGPQTIPDDVMHSTEGDNGDENGFSFLSLEVFLSVPQVIICFCVLPFTWSEDNCPDAYLNLWTLLFALKKVFSLISRFRLARLFELRRVSSTLERIDGREVEMQLRIINGKIGMYRRGRLMLNHFGIIWLVVGSFWVSSSFEVCSETAPTLFYLDFVLVIVGFITLFLPCIFLLLLVPLLIVCFPCLMRMLGKKKPRGATKKEIESLKEEEFDLEKSGEKECSICLNTFVDKDRVRKLKCFHLFHVNCCDSWLVRNGSCPVCRKSIFRSSADEESNETVDERTVEEEVEESL